VVKELEANDRDAETSRQNNDQQQLLAHLERGLYLRRRLHPEASPEVAAACHQLCEVCNVAGTSLLSQGHLKGAHELLKRAEQVADRNQRDKAITWVLKDWLNQVYKITESSIADEDIFENAVEYTDLPLMEGQIQVSIEFNKYTELVDRGILVDWAGAETLTE
jgi:hypothetical protein